MEKTMSVSTARQNLMKLTKQVSERMDKVVLTNKGKAETVLMSFAEYRSLMAAAELAMHPEVLAETMAAYARIENGGGISLEDAIKQLEAVETERAPLEPALVQG